MPGRRNTPAEPAVTHEKLVKLAKQDMGHSAAAAELGVTVGQISSLAWSYALVEAGRYSTVPATTASVKKLRDVEENRWELIAARIGESVAHAKELYGGEAAASTVKRGRKTTEAAGGKKATGKTGTAAAATPRRARTRAERAAARASNPS